MTPANGQIEPGETAEVTVTADGSGLLGGNYSGLLRVRSIADQSELEVPVDLSTNEPPTVELVAPVENSAAVTGENVEVSAQVDDRHDPVTEVQFFEGQTLIATVAQAPFTIVWQPVARGFLCPNRSRHRRTGRNRRIGNAIVACGG